MKSSILEGSSRIIIPLLLLLSAALLLQGHHEAGGAFAGGLVAAAALVLRSIVIDPKSPDRDFSHCRIAISAGLLMVLAATLLPLFIGKPVLTILSLGFPLPAGAYADTSLLFELGVYLVAAGSALLVLESVIYMKGEASADSEKEEEIR